MTTGCESHTLAFDPARHAYMLDGRPATAVTKVAELADAPDLLAAMKAIGPAEMERRKVLAGEFGTAIHAAGAAMARGVPLLPLQLGERFAASVELLGNWMADNVDEVLYVEEPMASPRLRVAGKPDLICTLVARKRPVIVDYKSGAGVYLGAVLQQAAYRLIAKEWLGLVCERLIIHMPAPAEGGAPALHEIPLRRHSVDEAAFYAAHALWRRSQEETT